MKPENLLRKKIMFKIIKFQNFKHGCFGMNSYHKYYPKVMLNLKNRSPIASESRIKTNQNCRTLSWNIFYSKPRLKLGMYRPTNNTGWLKLGMYRPTNNTGWLK